MGNDVNYDWWMFDAVLYEGDWKFWHVKHNVDTDEWNAKRRIPKGGGFKARIITSEDPWEERILAAETAEKAIERCKKEGMNHL